MNAGPNAAVIDFRTTVLRVGDGIRVGEGILAVGKRGGDGRDELVSGNSELRRGDAGSAVLAAFSRVPVLPPGDDGALDWCEAFRRWASVEKDCEVESDPVSDNRRLWIGIAGIDILDDGGEKEAILRVGEVGDKGREAGRRIVDDLTDTLGEAGLVDVVGYGSPLPFLCIEEVVA